MHNESEQAAARYERACDNYSAAKDMVKNAEEKLMQDERLLDSACQEMLNHATIKVIKKFYEFTIYHIVAIARKPNNFCSEN